MRTKVLLGVTLLALGVLLPAIYFRNASTATPPDASSADQTDSADASAPQIPYKPTPRPLKPVHVQEPPPSATASAADLNASDHADYVLQRRAELIQMGMSDDPAALKTLLSELNNQDPEIRKTALNAVIDFGSKDAIPTLENQLAWTDDLHEKMEIERAIEFLQLPPAHIDAAPLSQQSTAPSPAENN